MTGGDAPRFGLLLDTHWRAAAAIVDAAETLHEPTGANPAALLDAAANVSALAEDAMKAGLLGLSRLATMVSQAAVQLAQGTVDPLGPVGGALGPAAQALEDALVLLEAEETPADVELNARAQWLARVLEAVGAEGRVHVLEHPEQGSLDTEGADSPGPVGRCTRSESSWKDAKTPHAPHRRLGRSGEQTPTTAHGATTAVAWDAAPIGEASVDRWGPWEPSYPDLVGDYFEEIEAHLDNLQTGLLRLAGGDDATELIHGLFRSSHSIKGQSGQMGVMPIERVAHKLEDVLDRVRERVLVITPRRAEVLMGAIDAMTSMVQQLRASAYMEHPVEAEIAAMASLLCDESPQNQSERASRSTMGAVRGAVPGADRAASSPGGTTRLPGHAGGSARETGGRPGALEAQQADGEPRDAAPGVRDGEAARPALQVSKGKGPADGAPQYLRVDFAKVDRALNRVGDLFVNKIKLGDAVRSLDELQFEMSRLQNVLGRARDAGEDGLRLSCEDAQRLQEGMARLQGDMERATERLAGAMGETNMISADLRDQVMEMRMVPVDSILGRLGRVVFDALLKENRATPAAPKQAKLQVTGSGAELDKMIASMLEVPLVHIVRNAVAHGIEPAAERAAAGKPTEGRIGIRAGQQGSRFVIEATDDGRGMDPEMIGRVALGKGIVTQEALALMSRQEVLGLVFKPGFTTVEQADDLKGRGVGLDEVMAKIRAVKGTVEVVSEVGRGTRVTLSLPLTLAITTVVLGEVEGETLAIPMAAVERVVRVEETQVELMGEAEVFTLLGQSVPLVRLDDLLGVGRPPARRPDASYVIVMASGEKRIGLAMDRMQGQREVVIRSLGTLLREVPLIAGATLLGDRCVLILNPHEIAANLSRRGGAQMPVGAAEGGRRHALVIDDDGMARVALRRLFEQAGLDVTEAADGLEGLEAAGRRSFELVSTDVVMPRMDGYELTRRLRALAGYQRVPILMITSKDLEVDRRAGFEAGVDHYVTKPFERRALLELVREVLG